MDVPESAGLIAPTKELTAALHPAVSGKGFHPGHAGDLSLRPRSFIGPMLRPSGQPRARSVGPTIV